MDRGERKPGLSLPTWPVMLESSSTVTAGLSDCSWYFKAAYPMSMTSRDEHGITEGFRRAYHMKHPVLGVLLDPQWDLSRKLDCLSGTFSFGLIMRPLKKIIIFSSLNVCESWGLENQPAPRHCPYYTVLWFYCQTDVFMLSIYMLYGYMTSLCMRMSWHTRNRVGLRKALKSAASEEPL